MGVVDVSIAVVVGVSLVDDAVVVSTVVGAAWVAVWLFVIQQWLSLQHRSSGFS